ncbi:MAG: SRPBCC domain-containing protein [Micromonosporaceae bacterium]|nr:SRPBCC domain-containing protein [Micromonosporaceae bacterium]
MTVMSVQKDPEALTMTFVAQFDATAERLWRVLEDPRQLERWWGPPGWPATFDLHEFKVGGDSRYYMTAPDGNKARGWWKFTAIEAPERLEFDSGFAGDNGEPLDVEDAMHMVITIEPAGDRTQMTVLTRFASLAQMERNVSMHFADGMRMALGQIDDLLAGAAP